MERMESTEDWLKGKLNGQRGVLPGEQLVLGRRVQVLWVGVDGRWGEG